VLKCLDIGAKIRFRLQTRAVALDNTYGGSLPQTAAAPLSCNFGGFDGSIFLNLHLTFTRQEE
jgi:hypothetical protein